ncbi:B-cell linker protein [Pteropus vampyrus]|uniref:B-cell linker protein n=1 Tax=Pteropus vampyrus TaxID=132908 RepID=A0A6P6BKL1_PTEVA|nr:B-cell linker protein [Pteropus vampyrus]
MDKLNKITVPASQKLRQLQKMVHDIKNNEGGIMNKIKKLKVKAPPNVPRRDYASESPADEEEQWSDDFNISLLQSVNYISGRDLRGSPLNNTPYKETEAKRIKMTCPPSLTQWPRMRTQDPCPTEEESTVLIRVFLPSFLPSFIPNIPSSYHVPALSQVLRLQQGRKRHTRSTYTCISVIQWQVKETSRRADNRSSQRQSPPFSKTLPCKPSWPSAKARLASTMPISTSLPKPQVPPKPKDLEDEADYVVPVEDEDENYIHPTENSSLPSEKAPMVNRSTKPNNSSKPAPPPVTASGRNSGVWDSKSSLPALPSPLPRAGKKPATPLKITPLASLQNASSVCEEKPIPAERHRGSSHRQEAVQSPVFPPAQKKVHQKPIPLPRFPEGGSPTVNGPLPSFSSNSNLSEQVWNELIVYYLQERDGSFLIRKSSGHDSKQPYTLVVFFNKRVYNIPVRFIEATKQYALGRKKNGEEYFGSVAEIIKNHQHSPLVLIDNQNNTKDSTRLKYAVKVL